MNANSQKISNLIQEIIAWHLMNNLMKLSQPRCFKMTSWGLKWQNQENESLFIVFSLTPFKVYVVAIKTKCECPLTIWVLYVLLLLSRRAWESFINKIINVCHHQRKLQDNEEKWVYWFPVEKCSLPTDVYDIVHKICELNA